MSAGGGEEVGKRTCTARLAPRDVKQCLAAEKLRVANIFPIDNDVQAKGGNDGLGLRCGGRKRSRGGKTRWMMGEVVRKGKRKRS